MIPQDAGLPDPKAPTSTHFPQSASPIAGRIDPAPPRPQPPGGATPPPGLSAAPDVMGLLVALRHRWVSAVLLGGTLAVIAGVSVWYLLTPKNTAFAQLQVSFETPAIIHEGYTGPSDFKTTLITTAGQLMSPTIIASALKRDEVKRLGLDQKEVNPVQAIAEDLKVDTKENSELLTILFSHHDPQVALTVVNGIKDAYMEDVVANSKRNERSRKVTELEKVYATAVEGLKTKKESLKKIAKDLGTIDPQQWQLQRLDIMQDLKGAKDNASKVAFKLIETRAALDTIESRLKATKDRGKADALAMTAAEKAALEAAVEEALDKDAELKELHQQKRAHEQVLDNYVNERKLRPDSTHVVGQQRKLAGVQAKLDERTRLVTAKVKRAASRPTGPVGPNGEDPEVRRVELKSQIESLVALEEKLTESIEELSKQAARTPVLAAEYEQKADEIKQAEGLLKQLGEKKDREQVEMNAAPRIRSFQDAELMKKETKKQLLAAAVAPVAVFGAVSMGLAYLEFRKRRVHSSAEISRGLGIRVVGAVPCLPHLERRLVTPAGECDLEGTPVMESIDAIRTRLLHEANTRSTRVVMVTSAGPGEGKTTLASALATSLARAGRKTLLVDGDLRRPTVHELFEVAMQPGFSEVLLAEVEMAEAAQETPQENLWVMPAGQWDREVLLALSRDGLEGVFEKLAEEFDFLVIDSHPVLSATDSLLIGRQADAVLLSVLREVSQMPRVYAAQQQLAAVGIRVLGAVVNAANPEEVYSTPATPVAVA